jgi:catechol 2,3-dioxygenase-like lactoylglutathione lyase family enzyme
MLTGISAITLATHDMARAVEFYQSLGFALKSGGSAASFSSFHAGGGYLNLTLLPAESIWGRWGRAIFYVDDVDAQYSQAASGPNSPREMGHGESDISTSRIRTDTNSASRDHSDALLSSNPVLSAQPFGLGA